MGNSGVAIASSSAPSYYNPSLLNKKKQDSYSLSANSFGTLRSKSEGQETSSLSLNPSYLGNIIVGTNLVHELFFYSLAPSRYKVIANKADSNGTSVAELQTDLNQVVFGYSMAFKSIPFALSYYADFYQFKSFGFTEYTSSSGATQSTTRTKSEISTLGLGISVSGHFDSDSYTMGYHFKSRRLNMYSKAEGSGKTYVYGSPGPTDYTKSEFAFNDSGNPIGHTVSIGHGFKAGDHEFLTDTNLYEQSDLNYRFKLVQTFGYKMNSDSGHQFLTGLSHQIGSGVKYFGQSTYYSAGYSWLTRAMRSALGVYYYSSRLDQDISALGLTFGSEFSY